MKTWTWRLRDMMVFAIIGFVFAAVLGARAADAAQGYGRICTSDGGSCNQWDDSRTIDRTDSEATRTIDFNMDLDNIVGFTCFLSWKSYYDPLAWEDHSATVSPAAGVYPDNTMCITSHGVTAPGGFPNRTSRVVCSMSMDEYPDAIPYSNAGSFDLSTEMTMRPTAPIGADVAGFTLSAESDRWVWDVNEVCSSYDTMVMGFGSEIEVDVEDAGCSVDGDGDGVCDDSATDADNCTAIHNPGQRDDDGDGYGNLCDYDVDQNCVTGISDVMQVYGDLGAQPPWSPAEQGAQDVDENDAVGISDVSLIFGELANPPGSTGRSCADCTDTGANCP